MDYESRISKIEAQLATNQKEIDRLHPAISELRKLMLERFDRIDITIHEWRQHTDLSIKELRQQNDELRHHTDLSTCELRTHTDHSIGELRAHTDHSIGELRTHTDQSISELRQQLEAFQREASVNMRWMMGMWLSTIGLLAGLGGRIFGMY